MLHKYLAYFKAIAEAGTVSAAAETLHISQPALSRSLRILEGQLDAELFRRDGRGMILTDYGRTLYRHVCFMEQEFSHAEEEIEAMRGRGAQRLIIGAGLVWLVQVLPGAIASFRTRFAETRIEVYAGDSTALLKEFVTGRYDLILCGLQDVPSLDGLVCRPLIGPKFTMFAGRTHPLFDLAEERRAQSVDTYDLALYRSNFGDGYDPLHDYRMVSTMPPERIAFISTSLPNIFEVLHRTDMVASLPIACRAHAELHGVREISTALRRFSFESGAIYRRDADNRDAIIALIEEMDLDAVE